MDQPTRELLRQDVKALDVPSVPKATHNGSPESGAYAPLTYATPIQGRLHPPLDPNASNVEVGREASGDLSLTYVVASGPTEATLNVD